MNNLDKRIGDALTNAITSADLAALIEEVTAAADAASTAAKKIRREALDPIAWPDPNKARAAIENANFAVDRLNAALPRLQVRLTEVGAAEYADRWSADYERVATKRDLLADEYAELYPKFVAQLVDLFSRVEALDQECSRIDSAAPSGELRRLRGVELTARGLKNFSTHNPSIAKKLQLPDWTNSDRTAWPPRRPSMAAEFAMSMMPPYNPRYSAEWAAAQKADNVRRAANEARWAEEEAAREAEKRRTYEASLRR